MRNEPATTRPIATDQGGSRRARKDQWKQNERRQTYEPIFEKSLLQSWSEARGLALHSRARMPVRPCPLQSISYLLRIDTDFHRSGKCFPPHPCFIRVNLWPQFLLARKRRLDFPDRI